MEQPVHVHIEHLLPGVHRVVPHLDVGASDASAVDQHIHARQGRGLRGGVHHRGVVGHIHLYRVDHRTQLALAQLLGGFAHARHITVPDRDAGARGQHALCNGKAQACGPSGDDRVAALHVKQVHVCLSEKSNGHATVDHVGIARGEDGFVGSEESHDGRNLCCLRQPPHGLAVDEVLARLHRVGVAVDAVLQ